MSEVYKIIIGALTFIVVIGPLFILAYFKVLLPAMVAVVAIGLCWSMGTFVMQAYKYSRSKP